MNGLLVPTKGSLRSTENQTIPMRAENKTGEHRINHRTRPLSRKEAPLQRTEDQPLRVLPEPLRQQLSDLRSLPIKDILRRSTVGIAVYLEQALPYIREAIRKGYSLHEIYSIMNNRSTMAIGERQFRKYMKSMLSNCCIACGQQRDTDKQHLDLE